MTYQGFRNPLSPAKTVDYQAIKKNAFHDEKILVVSLDDPSIAWPERQILMQVGEKLYGKRSAGS